MRLSAFIICYARPINAFVIWPPWNFNSIIAWQNSNETVQARYSKEKKSFGKIELILRNLLGNVYTKKSKINETAVKKIFTVEIAT